MLKTIDELLVWLEKSSTQYGAGMDASARDAIRAILEQHNQPMTKLMWQQRELEAIRAFVERVEKRAESVYCQTNDLDWPQVHLETLRKELAAMKEAE